MVKRDRKTLNALEMDDQGQLPPPKNAEPNRTEIPEYIDRYGEFLNDVIDAITTGKEFEIEGFDLRTPEHGWMEAVDLSVSGPSPNWDYRVRLLNQPDEPVGTGMDPLVQKQLAAYKFLLHELVELSREIFVDMEMKRRLKQIVNGACNIEVGED